MNDECEMCAMPATGRRQVIEKPSEGEAAALSRHFWVIDPARLVFCTEECRVKWHGLRRKAIWQQHPDTCACVACLGRS